MKVFRYNDKPSATPYLDNCYVGEQKINEADEDITSYASLLAFMKAGQIDYLSFRTTLKGFNFASLTEEDKANLVSEYVAPDYATMLLYKTEQELSLIYAKMLHNQKVSRERRYDEITYTAGFALKDNELYQFLAYDDIKTYKQDYIEVGHPALYAFIACITVPELGIDFTTNGFDTKPYFSIQLQTDVLQILNK